MGDLRYLSIFIAVIPLAAACSSAPDVGTSTEPLGQYAAVKITQMDNSVCAHVDCGLASAAMMRAVMSGSDGSASSLWPCSNNSTCPTGKSKASAKVMREYYNAITLHHSFEDNPDYCGKGSDANGLATTLAAVHKSAGGHPGDGGPDLSADCAVNATACTGHKKSMSQCEFQKRLSPSGGTCDGTKFLGGYVAAIRGSINNDPKGSPCYDGPGDHFIFAHDYDPSTDTFTVYDPACSIVKEAAWSSSRLFGWANGGAGMISGMAYGRGMQHGSTQPPPEKCIQQSDAEFCASQNKNCGPVTDQDNCNVTRTVDCGSCSGSDTCGGGGTANVCGYGDYNDEQDFPVSWWLTGTIRNDGLCARAHVSSGEVRMTACSQTDTNQNWRRTTSRQLQNVATSTCAQASTTTKAGVVSHAACSTSTLQDWSMTGVEIVQGVTGQCLSIPYGDYTDGAPVRYRACSDKDNQKFTYDLANETISPASAPNLCFDAAGTSVTLKTCNGSASQKWDDAHRGFQNRAGTNMCLGIAGGPNAEAPADAEVQTCSNTMDQMWGMRGKLKLNASSNLCLKATPSGQQMVTTPCDDNDPLQRMTVWSQP